MEKNKLKVCGKTNHALRRMQGITGLTPNYLCRIGFCLSLQTPVMPDIEDYQIPNDTEVREFNRYTLFGKDNFIYMALLKQWVSNLGLDTEQQKNDILGFDRLTEAHLNRGSLLLIKKVNNGLLSLNNLF